MENAQETNSYQRYLELGGIINEEDYKKAFETLANIKTEADITRLLRERSKEEDPEIAANHTRTLVRQATGVADSAEIELYNSEDNLDPKIILYIILRTDKRTRGTRYYHDDMWDRQTFVEALRILGDAESVKTMIEKYNLNTNFIYQRGDEKKEKTAT